MALAATKVFLHIRADSDGDRTKHDAKKSLRKLAGGLTLTLDDADVVVFHHGSEMVLQNALGLRKPVVSPMWLKACKEAGRKLDVEPFVLVDSNSSAAVIKANASPVATPPKLLSKKPSPNATPPMPAGGAGVGNVAVPKRAGNNAVPAAPIALVDEEEDDDAALLAPKQQQQQSNVAAVDLSKPKDETPTPKKPAGGRKSAANKTASADDDQLAAAPVAVVDKLAPAAVAKAAESNASAAATAAYLADLLDDEESQPVAAAAAAAKAKAPKAKAAITKSVAAAAKRGRAVEDGTAATAPSPPQPKAAADAAGGAKSPASDQKPERKKPGPKPKLTKLSDLARTQPATASPAAVEAVISAAAAAAAAASSEGPTAPAAAPKPKAKKAGKKKKAAAVAAPVTVIAGAALRSSSESPSSSSGSGSDDDEGGDRPAAAGRTSGADSGGRVVGGVHKYQIALTGVTADERESLGQIIVALGGELVDDVFGRSGTKPTHLVADGATSAVSPKILLALGLGLPILRPAWLLSSLSQGRWRSVDGVDGDGEPFFVPSFDRASWLARQELMYRRDPRMLPDRPARGPQFMTGTVLYFAGASSYPDNNVWAELVHTVGGDVVRTVAAAGLSAVVLMSNDALQTGSARGGRRRSGGHNATGLPKWLQSTPPAVPIVTPQWIADSIAACAAVPFDGHLAPGVPARPIAEGTSTAGAAVASSDDSPPSLQVVGRVSTAPGGAQQRLSTTGSAAAAGRSPGTPHQAALAIALKKRSPGPSSAMKEAAHQWSTQKLRESLSPTRPDSDDDDDA